MKLLITEEQYNRLFTEDFDWKESEDGKSVDITFNKERDDNFMTANDTRQYYNDVPKRLERKEALVMKPTVIKLNRSKLDCYALFMFNEIKLQQAIKNNTWGTRKKKDGETIENVNANWANKEEFIDYSINYAKELIENIFQRLRRLHGWKKARWKDQMMTFTPLRHSLWTQRSLKIKETIIMFGRKKSA